jgi:hypothetical protein
VALGCQDPAERVSEAKERDGRRQMLVELFQTWWDAHGARPVTIAQLDDRVRKLADPHERGRQFLAAAIERLSGTRAGGYVLTRQAAAGKWGAATYALRRTGEGHREDRGDGDSDGPDAPDAAGEGASAPPETGRPNDAIPPMVPMATRSAAAPEMDRPPPWRQRL